MNVQATDMALNANRRTSVLTLSLQRLFKTAIILFVKVQMQMHVV